LRADDRREDRTGSLALAVSLAVDPLRVPMLVLELEVLRPRALSVMLGLLAPSVAVAAGTLDFDGDRVLLDGLSAAASLALILGLIFRADRFAGVAAAVAVVVVLALVFADAFFGVAADVDVDLSSDDAVFVPVFSVAFSLAFLLRSSAHFLALSLDSSMRFFFSSLLCLVDVDVDADAEAEAGASPSSASATLRFLLGGIVLNSNVVRCR